MIIGTLSGPRLADKRVIVIVILAIVVASTAAFAFLQILGSGGNGISSTNTTTSLGLPSYPQGTRFIRIRALEKNSMWALPDYDAQQVLRIISDLKPEALERYVSGPQNASAPVPVAPGSPPMTVGEFLNASLRACECNIIPRLSLGNYDSGKFLNEAASLLSMPVYPKMRYLSLDSWTPFASSHTSDEVKGMFQRLYDQGWAGVGLNECGGYSPSYGYATFASFCVSTNTWKPIAVGLAQLKNEPNIKLRLLYIDFPDAMKNFSALSTTEEADIFAQKISPAQSEDGFVFVYPIAQSFWDSMTRVTPAESAYGGASIYEVMKGLMNQYNAG